MKEPVRPTLTRRERQIMEILYRHGRSEEHTSELQSLAYLVCRLLLGKEEHTSELQSLAYLVCRLLLGKKQELRDRESDDDRRGPRPRTSPDDLARTRSGLARDGY